MDKPKKISALSDKTNLCGGFWNKALINEIITLKTFKSENINKNK